LARAAFALKLDPQCSDAYLIRGAIASDHRRYHEAKAHYERAMELAATKLGPLAFQEQARKSGAIHFWYSTGTRFYMRARAALAYLLWQKMGKLDKAIAHFRGMLFLNPGDNQGNRYALLCCLLESGDDEALGEALHAFSFYTDDAGEKMDLRETCWHYTHACWLFRRSPLAKEGIGSQEANSALRRAFKLNRHVPLLLLDPKKLEHIDDPGHYGAGDIYEAQWYVEFSLKAWQQTKSALLWLETVARRAKVVP
jgi:tetratricopeptide (TPR) repeat protein